jgi:recombination protein RecR
MKAPLDDLIRSISKLPGVGPRMAQKVVLFLLKNDKNALNKLIQDLNAVYKNVQICDVCGNFGNEVNCDICLDDKRDPSRLCVVETVSDLWAIERARIFPGRYHILGGKLSAIDNTGPDQLNLNTLFQRVKSGIISEIIVALSATLEGQSTLFYLSDVLKPYNVSVSALAQGIPIGGELNYLDDATLAAAFLDRRMLIALNDDSVENTDRKRQQIVCLK